MLRAHRLRGWPLFGLCWAYLRAGMYCSRSSSVSIRATYVRLSVAPILILIIAMWYKKEEQGRRISWFYVCNSLTQIFGGFVAYGVSFAHTRFANWRIFYIVIGALTMVNGLLVAMLLPDSPVKAKRFTDAEKVAALLRVKDNQRYIQALHLDLENRADTVQVGPKTLASRETRSSRLSETLEYGSSASLLC